LPEVVEFGDHTTTINVPENAKPFENGNIKIWWDGKTQTITIPVNLSILPPAKPIQEGVRRWPNWPHLLVLSLSAMNTAPPPAL
jgi:hypothetical protein